MFVCNAQKYPVYYIKIIKKCIFGNYTNGGMKKSVRRKEKTIFADHYQAFYLKYAGDLIFFARKFVNHQTAEDIVHDVFLKIWDAKSTIVVEEEMQNYLLTMVQNGCYDFLKHRQVQNGYVNNKFLQLKVEELQYYETTTEDSWPENDLEALYESIEKLPERRRDIFKRAYIQGEKHVDIANKLEISVRTVETHIYKALKTLRNSLVLLIPFAISLGYI